MSHKLTHTEFLKRLPNRIKENFEVLNKYKTHKDKILLKDTLGILYSVKPFDLLSERYPTIITAVNQTDAISKIVKNIFGNKLQVCTKYRGCAQKIVVKDTLGITYFTTPRELKSGKFPRITSAIDINKAFIIKASLVHKNKYDYSNIELIHIKDKINIICPIHGIFNQRAYLHLRGQGCPICGRKTAGKTHTKKINIFIKEAREIHNNKYDYSKVNYTGGKNKVVIICSKHGEFKQTAFNHLRGAGCPKCALEKDDHLGYNKTNWVNLYNKAKGIKLPIVYIIKVFDKDNTEEFVKIGRSYRSMNKRLGKKPNSDFPYYYKVIKTITGDVDYIFELEKKLHKIFADYKYTPKNEFKGQSECFTIDIIKELKYEKV